MDAKAKSQRRKSIQPKDLKYEDSKGLEVEGFPYIKNKETLRILLFGDSFTFGDEVKR